MIGLGASTQELRNWKAVVEVGCGLYSNGNDCGFAAGVKVLWAGDLNGDAQLDLLLKQGDGEIGSSVELFLSSGDAAAPRLVLADKFDFGGC